MCYKEFYGDKSGNLKGDTVYARVVKRKREHLTEKERSE
jgi:hypothetical protein